MSTPRLWDRVAGWTLPALILLGGLVPPHVYPEQVPLFCLGAFLLVLALLGSGRMDAPRGGVGASLLAGASLLILTSLAGLQPLRSVRQDVLWLVSGVVFLAAKSSAGRSASRRALVAVVILGTFLAALGLYQGLVLFPTAGAQQAAGSLPSLAGHPQAQEAARVRVASGRAVGTLGLPALLASILILGTPLALGEALAAGKRSRWVWLAAAGVQLAGLAATRSMGGMAALLLAAAVCVPLWAPSGSRPRRVAAAGLIIAGIAILAVVAPRLAHRGTGSAYESISQRIENWKAAASMLADHPLLGVGPGNFGVALPAHRTAAGNETQHAHNSYLEIAADAGLPAAAVLLLALGGLVSLVRTGSRSAGSPRRRAAALAAAAWAIQNLADFGLYVAAVTIPFAAVAGFLAGHAGAGEPPGEEAPARAGIPSRSMLLLVSILAVLVSLPDSMCRKSLQRASLQVTRHDMRAAIREAREATVWNPLDPEAHAFLSQALVAEASGLPLADDGRRALVLEAIFEGEEAARLDPVTANRRAILAAARAAAGDGAGAYADMAIAARLNPFRAAYRRQRDELQALLTGVSPVHGSAPAPGQSP